MNIQNLTHKECIRRSLAAIKKVTTKLMNHKKNWQLSNLKNGFKYTGYFTRFTLQMKLEIIKEI